MAHALALDGQEIALELHELLRDIDPIRWRDEVEEGARARLEALQARVAELRDRFEQLQESYTDASMQVLRERLDLVAATLREYAPADGLPMPDLRREWMDFRRKAGPAYEALARALRVQEVHVPALRPTNYARNVFHVASALLSLVLVETVLTPTLMLIIAGGIAAFAWSCEIGKRLSPTVDHWTWVILGRMGHPHERVRVNSATWFSTALLVLALTQSHLVAAVALVVLGLADPAAGLIGRRWGRVQLVHGRTVEGTTAFVLAGALGALAVLRLWHPGLGWGLTLGVIAAAVVPAALAELFASRIDDNLLVPAAAAAGAGGFALLVGIPL